MNSSYFFKAYIPYLWEEEPELPQDLFCSRLNWRYSLAWIRSGFKRSTGRKIIWSCGSSAMEVLSAPWSNNILIILTYICEKKNSYFLIFLARGIVIEGVHGVQKGLKTMVWGSSQMRDPYSMGQSIYRKRMAPSTIDYEVDGE